MGTLTVMLVLLVLSGALCGLWMMWAPKRDQARMYLCMWAFFIFVPVVFIFGK